MKYFYLFSFIVALVFIQGICEIQVINDNISLTFWNCDLAEATHRYEKCDCGKYDLCLHLDQIGFYQNCDLSKEGSYNIFNGECRYN